jgi:two-component system OmpR family sensor kinase
MSLRLRLTLLNATLMGGILLVFGAAEVVFANLLVIVQADNTLARVSQDVVDTMHVNSVGEIDVMNLQQDFTTNTSIQIWGRDGKLQAASSNVRLLDTPLDPNGLWVARPVYRITTVRGVYLRVLSVPLQAGERIIGVMQVATSLVLLDTTQSDLIPILLVSVLLAMLLAGGGSSLVLGRALSPLAAIHETVDQINRADDLSRRIPYQAQSEDEIGELVQSFNQTLERLEALFTSQQRFLADVSHELRTPLTVIKGNVDLMRRMKEVDPESLASMYEEVGRLTRLVGGLLLLAQAESGKLTLNLGRVSLDVLLMEVFQEMHILAGTRVHMSIKEIDQLEIQADRDRIKQVLLNLVGNAIQYTPQGGDVLLSLAKVGNQARTIVRDTGPGIPAEDLPHIFERFYRAEKSRTRAKSGGFGLGLSIAQWIVENHGGRIDVESKEGKGTTFTIWLPLLDDQSSAPTKPVIQRQPAN